MLSMFVWTEGLNAEVWMGAFQLYTYTWILLYIHILTLFMCFNLRFFACYTRLNYACLYMYGTVKLGQEIHVNISPKISLELSKCWLKSFPINHFFTFAFAIFTLSDFKLTLLYIKMNLHCSFKEVFHASLKLASMLLNY